MAFFLKQRDNSIMERQARERLMVGTETSLSCLGPPSRTPSIHHWVQAPLVSATGGTSPHLSVSLKLFTPHLLPGARLKLQDQSRSQGCGSQCHWLLEFEQPN